MDKLLAQAWNSRGHWRLAEFQLLSQENRSRGRSEAQICVGLIPRFARSLTEIQNGKVIHICFIIHFPKPTVQLGSGARHTDLSFETSIVVSLVLLSVLLPCPLRARKSSLALAQGHTIPREILPFHLAKWASPWGNTQTVCVSIHLLHGVYRD